MSSATVNVLRCWACQVTDIVPRFQPDLNFFNRLSCNCAMSSFTGIRAVEAAIVRAGTRTAGHNKSNMRTPTRLLTVLVPLFSSEALWLLYLPPRLLTYLLTHSRTAWCRVLLEKVTGFQLIKKFPAYYGTQRFITAFTSARHLSLSGASSIQSILPHPTS